VLRVLSGVVYLTPSIEFRDRPFQPLTHLSINGSRTEYSNRRTDAQKENSESHQVGPPVHCPLFTPAASVRLFLFSVT